MRHVSLIICRDLRTAQRQFFCNKFSQRTRRVWPRRSIFAHILHATLVVAVGLFRLELCTAACELSWRVGRREPFGDPEEAGKKRTSLRHEVMDAILCTCTKDSTRSADSSSNDTRHEKNTLLARVLCELGIQSRDITIPALGLSRMRSWDQHHGCLPKCSFPGGGIQHRHLTGILTRRKAR